MLSRTPKHLWVNAFALSALALGVQNTYALQLSIPNMKFNNDYAASGSINFEQGAGVFTSLDPFYNQQWTSTVQQVFTTPGVHNFAGTSLQGTYNYQFTLATGQVAAGVFFNWNGNNDIPVLTAFDCSAPDQGCVAILPAGATGNSGSSADGVAMQTQPFKGSAPAFNSKEATTSQAATGGITISPEPIALPRDVIANGLAGAPVTWIPSINGTTARTCTIDTPPSNGSATVQSDCSTGSFTGSVSGANTFTYRVTSDNGAGDDNAMVTVNLSAGGGNVPPTAVPDAGISTTAATAVVIDVLANDSDVDGTLVPASVTISTPPTNGAASKDPVTGQITYTPNAGFCGTDTLFYTVLDNNAGISNAAEVTIDVSATLPCSSQSVTFEGGSSDPDNDGLVSLSELLSAGIPADGGVSAQCIGGCFDYKLTGLSTPTATVILPLSAPVPNLARVRKWDGSAWVDFDSSGADAIASTVSVAGECPGSGYTSGLKVGDDCLQLVITDGGPNDQDGVTDSTIIDPVGIGRSGLNSATTDLSDAFGSVGGDGCTIATMPDATIRFDAAWAILLGYVGWLGFGRKRRRQS